MMSTSKKTNRFSNVNWTAEDKSRELTTQILDTVTKVGGTWEKAERLDNEVKGRGPYIANVKGKSIMIGINSDESVEALQKKRASNNYQKYINVKDVKELEQFVEKL